MFRKSWLCVSGENQCWAVTWFGGLESSVLNQNLYFFEEPDSGFHLCVEIEPEPRF